MPRGELTAVTGVEEATAAVLAGVGITTLMDLVLAPRQTIRAALKSAGVTPLPSMSDIATWQDRARRLRLESPPSPGWDREASFVVSFERRAGDAGDEQRQTVVARAESDAPVQHVEADWSPDAVGQWIGTQIGDVGHSLRAAVPFLGGPSPDRGPAAPAAPAPSAPARGSENVIRHWNAVALEANRIAHTTGDDRGAHGPTGSARALAIVHLAMHDAYFSITGTYPTYLAGHGPAPTGADPEAAADAAAQRALSVLYASRASEFHRPELGGPGIAEGHAHGVAIADAILRDREADPDTGHRGYEPPIGRGQHRVDPAHHGQGFYGPFVGASRLFAVTQRHQLDPPPALDDDEYLRALREVRAKGIAPELMGTLGAGADLRTPEETLIGHFWAYDGPAGIGTPPRLYNQIVRRVSEDHGNSVEDDARLFALVNTAMADAGVLAWAEKYRYNLWRPVIGIREHDASMGGAGTAVAGPRIGNDCDPGWLPLGAPRTNPPQWNDPAPAPPPGPRWRTPDFPAYPSGHATFGAAALQSVRLFYGVTDDGPDDLFPGALVSDELDGHARDERGWTRSRHERRFPGGLWEMIEANGRSRVYLGVHWVFDAFAVDAGGDMDLSRNVGGVPLGLRVAKDLAANGLLRADAAG